VAGAFARIGCAAGRCKLGNVQNKGECPTDLKQAARLPQRKYGGAGRNRTADKGFADLCLTTWRPRPCCKELIRGVKRLPRERSVQALNQRIATSIPSSRSTILRQIFSPLSPLIRTDAEKGLRGTHQDYLTADDGQKASTASTGRVDAACRFQYHNLSKGRLAQRLERSVYTRKVVRSNRTVPTMVLQHL
jgi:hypothetical protein